MWKLVLAAVLLAGCSVRESAQPIEPIIDAQMKLKPPRRLTEGEALYLRHCAGCHGWEGRGEGPVAPMLGIHPPSLRRPELYERYSEAELTGKVQFGADFLAIPHPERVASAEADIDALMRYIKQLPATDWDAVGRGKETYDALCAYCHGIYGRGDGILAPAQASLPGDLGAASFQAKMSDEELYGVVSEGRGNMPGTRDILNREEIASVISYVRLLSPGYELYDRFCARCHGSDGYPPAADAPGSDEIFGVPPLSREELIGMAFDENYFRSRPDSVIRAWVRHMYKSDHSLMPHFSSDQNGRELRKILEYLRQLGPRS